MKGRLHPGDGRKLGDLQEWRIQNPPTLQSYSTMFHSICQDNCCIVLKLLLCVALSKVCNSIAGDCPGLGID